MKNLSKIFLIAFLFISLLKGAAYANGPVESGEEKKFSPGDLIMHHILDAHEWEFAHGLALPLPVIIYSEKGLDVFSSSHLYHSPDRTYNGYHLNHHDKIEAVDKSRTIYDISITKNVASMFISVAILVLIFIGIARSYGKTKGKAPKGIQSFFEPIIMYIRDDIGKGTIGPKYERFMPYLLTVFFFIWFNNLLGLFPGGANLTGNIAVTFILALLTFLVTTLSANGNYWKHILWTPGVPLPLRIIILPIEIVGMFTKPFSLMVRLFANITAGHIIILSFISLIFMFESYAVGFASTAFAVFMSMLELFVALLQAYVFTLLSAMYFASAVEEHQDHDYDHGH
ncbi:F0F1 ATP synthase subunit A [Sporocytophaga myxococcoides]|uniref:F0F1 ATP synthase subunit A n=1 Tax=Sporocytophaga myxococcoides TaxID=153721 RepID=UPI00040737AC|nr:F0F1 ATP synthase subunit A [Sporocytophaga myxococcoides]